MAFGKQQRRCYNLRRICIVVASRANYGRLKSVLKAVNDHPALKPQLIVAASALLDRWGCVDIIEKEFRIDEKVYCVVDGSTPGNMATTTGVFTIQLQTVFEKLRPDCVLVHADRYEQLATATAAAYMNIPVAHTQGGEVSGSIDDKVRNAISQLADIHFPATSMSAARLIRMGVRSDKVFDVGCTAIDTIADIDLSIPDNFLEICGGVGADIDFSKPYIVVVQHPVTTEYEDTETQIKETLEAIKSKGMQTVWLWPNVDAGTDEISGILRRFREAENPDYIRFIKNLPPEDFARLTYNSQCLIGNTSFGIREGAFLGVPYICVGTRQRDREHSINVVYSGYDRREIRQYIDWMMGRQYGQDRLTFGQGNAGKRIAEILAKTDVIKDRPLEKRKCKKCGRTVAVEDLIHCKKCGANT